MLRVTLVEAGTPSDPDGYVLRIGNGDEVVVSPGSYVFAALSPGVHNVTLSGAWVYCRLSDQETGTVTQPVSIAAGDTTRVTVNAVCQSALRNAIIFSAGRSGTFQVYAMRPDGTGETRITQDLGKSSGIFMGVASDGTKFVHVTGGPQITNLEVVSSTGSVLGIIPTSIACPTTPAWSPDGARIAFNTCGYGAIRVIDADGTGEVVVPNTLGWTPAWTADGTRLVHPQLTGNQVHLVISSIDGSSRTALTNVPGEWVEDPDVSPDGTKIVFTRRIGQNGSDFSIHVINVDGTGERLLVGGPGFKARPRWSLDGKTVIYLQDVPRGMWRVGSDGGAPVSVLSEPLGWLAWTR